MHSPDQPQSPSKLIITGVRLLWQQFLDLISEFLGRRHHVGGIRLCGPDYRQIKHWAQLLGWSPEAIVAALVSTRSESARAPHPFEDSDFEVQSEFLVEDGSIVSLIWDFKKIPLGIWSWEDGLNIQRIFFRNGRHNPNLRKNPPLLASLRMLGCKDMELTEIDLRLLPNIVKLDCSYNKLKTLDLRPTPRLKVLHCSGNPLRKLDPESLENLVSLRCNQCELTQLDLRFASKLELLDCSENSICTLNLNHTPNLVALGCACNRLSFLDIKNTRDLLILSCFQNNIGALDLQWVPRLSKLACFDNQLIELDLSHTAHLNHLHCGENKISELDLSHLPALTWLTCKKNLLCALDLRPVPNLTSLDCSDNRISAIDTRRSFALAEIKCRNNPLARLDLRVTPYDERFCYFDHDTWILNSSNQMPEDNLIDDIYQSGRLGQYNFQDVDYRQIVAWASSLKCKPWEFLKSLESMRTSTEFEDSEFGPCFEVQSGSIIALTLDSCWTSFDSPIWEPELNLKRLAFSYSRHQKRPGRIPDHLPSSLELLHCDHNDLDHLTLATNPNLRFISCRYNNIRSLDLSTTPRLDTLLCSANQIYSIELSHATELKQLDCSENLLQTLDLSKNSELVKLNCRENALKTLDIRHLKKLRSLAIDYQVRLLGRENSAGGTPPKLQ